MKRTLTIQESANLIALGVDPAMASMTIVTDEYNEQLENIRHPIFTLTDILSILPREIGNYELNISVTEEEYFVSYRLWDSMDDVSYIRDVLSGDQFSAPELIDALYQLLIWCLTEKKINLNTDKK